MCVFNNLGANGESQALHNVLVCWTILAVRADRCDEKLQPAVVVIDSRLVADGLTHLCQSTGN